MSIDPRTPVIVGVGQLNQHCEPADARSPIELFAEAIRIAGDDAGHGILDRVDTVVTVEITSWEYPDASAAVARLLGLSPRRTACSTVGGNSPQMLVNEFGDRILRGDADVVVIGGAESMRARWRARREPKLHLDWEVYDDPRCPEVLGSAAFGTNDWEMAHGMLMPTTVYPLFETALRAESGRSVAEHQEFLGRFYAPFSQIAADNPHAWSRTAYTPAEISTVSDDNRIVAFPYTKRMVANIDVDQAAALLLCSYETAVAAGVPSDRMVFLHAAADAHDHWWISEREAIGRSVAIGACVHDTLGAAGVDLDAIARFDLYSCFPSAVQMAMQSIGLAGPDGGDSRPVSVTGGLNFGGGPSNNYVTHSIARMVEVVRADPGSFGLTTALGWYATKHSAGLWSTTPPVSGRYSRVASARTQATVDAQPSRAQAGAYEGTMTVEGTSVEYHRTGDPHVAIVVGLTPDGRRAIATTTDTDAMHSIRTDGWDRATVSVRTDGNHNTVEA